MSLQSSLNAICDTALDAVVAVNNHGHIVGFNAEAEKLFGYARADVLGRPMAGLIVPERHRTAHNAGMVRFLETGQPKLIGSKVEIEALHRDGHEVPVELGLSILQIGGDTLILSFLRDLSDRKLREEEIEKSRDRAEKANAAKSFVVSMVAHDMRNALGGVIGNLALLDKKRFTPEEREIIDSIDDGARTLKRLLSDTLDLARLEAGEIEISPAPLMIQNFVGELVHEWEDRLSKTQVSLSVDIADDAPRRILIDEHRLRQVIANLISNATKYAPGAALSLKIERNGLVGLRIIVADDGPGFSESALATAFDPFLRPIGQATDGSGLGLAIVKTITEAMGGRIDLKSASGAGSRITIEFDTGRLAELSPETSNQPRFDALAVLLVEDNATNRLVATKMLEMIGCDVSVCEDGLAGAETAEKVGFDAIFMDIDLPKLNGKDAIRRIRAGNGPNATAPIIAFTAFAIRAQREEILASGADTILTKPVSSPEDFGAVLVEVLKENRQSMPESPEDKDNIVDADRLTMLRDTLGKEDFEILSVEFRKDLENVLGQVIDDHRTDESIRKATHIGMSLTGTLGATRAQNDAERLNSLAQNNKITEIEEHRLAFETSLRETITALDSFMEAC